MRIGRALFLLAAFFFALSANATRLTPSSRLTSQATSSGAQSTSADIPTGATWALIGFCYYNDAGHQDPTSVSLDGQSATFIASAGTASTVSIGLYRVSGFATGAAKTLAFTLGSTGTYSSMDIAVEYQDGTPTFGASAAAATVGSPGTATTSAIANSSGDLLLSAYCTGASDGAPTAGTGQTKLDDTNDAGANIYFGFTTETGTGSSDAQAITGQIPAIASIAVTLSTGAFDSSPAVISKTTTAYTVGGSLSGSGAVKAVACYAGSTAPTIAEINAAHCTGGSSPAASGNQSPNSAPYDFSITLTPSESPAFPLYDLYVTDGTTRAALASSFLNAPSTCGANANQACQFVQLTSVAIGSVPSIATLAYDGQTQNFIVGDSITGGTSGAVGQVMADSDSGATGTLTLWISSGTFQDNETITGSFQGSAAVNGTASFLYAANDVLVAPTYVSPGGSGVTLTIAANGNASYVSGTERETALNIKVYDYSAVGYASGDIDFVNNNVAPSCSGGLSVDVLLTNAAMSALDMDDFCSSIHGDALTSTEIGTLPTGLSLNGNTNVTSGTPTVENESGVTIRYVVSDTYGGVGIKDVIYYPITTLTLFDCTSSATTVTDCTNSIQLQFHGSIIITLISAQPSATVAAGDVISQSPTAGSEVAPFATVSLVSSVGPGEMPNCLASTVAACQALIAAVSATATLTQSTGCTSSSSVIYSQAPAVASTVSAGFQLTVFCR